jgi:type IV pilus assembly protein PilW
VRGRTQRGFSVIELMVASTVGLLIVAAVLGLFISNRKVYSETELQAELQENSRFALEYLLNDLRHAGFYGRARFFSLEVSSNGVSAVTGDCTGDAGAFDFELPIWGKTAASATEIGCITDALAVDGIPSDILVIRSVLPLAYLDTDDSGTVGDTEDNNGDGSVNAADELALGKAYVASNTQQGELFTLTSAHPLAEVPTVGASGDYPDGAIWEYSYSAYYIRNQGTQPPTLSRKRLTSVSNGIRMETEDLVEGIEGLRVMYGFDNDGDAVADRYVAASGVAADQWTQIVGVKLFVLARELRPDRTYQDTRDYVMGDTTVTATAGETASQGAKLQNFHRTMMMSTVSLRNMAFVAEEGAL